MAESQVRRAGRKSIEDTVRLIKQGRSRTGVVGDLHSADLSLQVVHLEGLSVKMSQVYGVAQVSSIEIFDRKLLVRLLLLWSTHKTLVKLWLRK